MMTPEFIEKCIRKLHRDYRDRQIGGIEYDAMKQAAREDIKKLPENQRNRLYALLSQTPQRERYYI